MFTMRRSLAPVFVMLLMCGLAVRAADDSNSALKRLGDTSDANLKNEAAIKQERLARQFKEFTQTLLRLAQRMEASGKPEDRQKALVLKKAILEASKANTDAKFDKLITVLKDSKELDLDVLAKSGDLSKDVLSDIQKILDILMTDNRDAELKAEIARMTELIKRLNEIIREEKRVRAITEKNTMDPTKLGKEQNNATEATKALARALDKKDGKPADPKDAKPMDPKDSKPGDPKDGKPGDPKDGKPSDKKDQPQDDQQNGKTPGKKQIEDAAQDMQKAEKNIEEKKNEDASNNQDEAIKKLEAAKKKLEELLAQLREEELERLLAALQQRCERMRAMQIEVRNETISVFKVCEASSDKKPTRTEVQKSLGLSDKENEIVREASKAMKLLEAEGSAVAFFEVFSQVRGDMQTVAVRLQKTDIGVVTQTIEQDIIDTLGEMIEALKKKQQEMKDKKASNSPPAPPQDQKLLDLLAELKLIRSLQVRVNNRTRTYASEYPELEQVPSPGQVKTKDEQEKTERLLEELKKLAEQQMKIFDVTNNIAKGKNEGGRP